MDPLDAARWLSAVLPATISTAFNPRGSKHAIEAAMLELVDAMAAARYTTLGRVCFDEELDEGRKGILWEGGEKEVTLQPYHHAHYSGAMYVYVLGGYV